MYPHRIRLLGPWEHEPAAGGPPQRVGIPCQVPGPARFRRRFHWPGRLAPHEHVWLTFADAGPAAEVRLNGQVIGRPAADAVAFEMEVTGLLQPRNELVVAMAAADAVGIRDEVALEVRCPAFLRDVHARSNVATGRLHVAGAVVGTCTRPLELYVLADGATLIYAPVTPGPFAVDGKQPGAIARVRVDLVDAATIWYTVECAVG